MNQSHIKERNYRMVETLRQQNMREQRRLNDRLTNRQGMKAAYNYEIASVSYEQRKLRQEMLKIKQSTPASAQVWTSKTGRPSTGPGRPIRTPSNNHVILPGQSAAPTTGHVQQTHRLVIDNSSGSTAPQTMQLPVLHSKQPEVSVQVESKSKSSRSVSDSNAPYNQVKPEMKAGSEKTSPDATPRPRPAQDFKKTMKEAQKARYVRHKEKQWFERELTVGEIFNKDIEQHNVVS